MASILNASAQGSLGIQPRTLIVRCRNAEASTALARGDLVRLDFSQSSTEPGQGDAAITSASNSKFANVVLGPTGNPATGSTTSSIYGIAQEAIAAGATGNIMFAGVTTASVASGTYAAGERVGIPVSGLTAGRMTRAATTQSIATVLVGGTTVTSITVLLQGEVAYGGSAT
jgi:hypothetical protein